jgi:glycosyltransferase involved in cell wall biosynthesis
VAYFAHFDAARGQGIRKKIDGFLNAAAANGWETRSVILNTPGAASHLKLGLEIARAKEDVLLIRSTAHHLAFILPFYLFAGLRRQIILEVPTPHGSALLELLRGKFSAWAKARMMFLLAVSGPFVFWPFDRVLQYAPESSWWMLGNRRRTRMTSNGIDLSQMSARARSPSWPSDTLRLLAVANVSHWHGYDRLLRAIRLRRDEDPGGCGIELTIVGNGDQVNSLRSLANELGLRDQVHFRAPEHGAELLRSYGEHHVAVGSLGSHRKGLRQASELKAREYCAVGIPFIAAGLDSDFPERAGFRYVVSASERIDDVAALLKRLCDSPQFPGTREIRAYAETHLDMRDRVRELLGDAARMSDA